jgi:hypothetical protein
MFGRRLAHSLILLMANPEEHRNRQSISHGSFIPA